MMKAQEERAVLATAVYRALKSTGKLASHRLLSYRCSRRCLLLDVLRFPAGVVYASPRYKLSPGVNDRASSASARAERTEDGDRHWRTRAYFAQDALNAPVTCDHVRSSISKEEIDADLGSGATEVVWPRRK
jgi:hypothetical protein